MAVRKRRISRTVDSKDSPHQNGFGMLKKCPALSGGTFFLPSHLKYNEAMDIKTKLTESMKGAMKTGDVVRKNTARRGHPLLSLLVLLPYVIGIFLFS